MQANTKMQQDHPPIDAELERQLEELRGVIEERRSRSRKLWETKKDMPVEAEEDEKKKKVVGKFTLYVTKHNW